MGVFIDHLLQDGTTYPYMTPQELVDQCATGVDPADDDVIDTVLIASTIMYYMTGRQFEGTETATIRPECTHKDDCTPRAIHLGLWPVTNIVSVRYEGTDHDPADFHIDEWKYMARDDGEPFPRCSSWYAAANSPEDSDTEAGGYVFEVQVEHGLTVPRLVKRATRDLACNLWQDSRNEACDLPDRVTSLSRQGVTMEINDYMDILNRGRIGIYTVDLALEVYNPKRLQSATFVWSPDMKGNRANRRYT